jgi:hypothetical protein
MYKYTAEDLEDKYTNEIEMISRHEWESWANHPCGRALKYKLIADQAGHFEDWVNGNDIEPELARWLIVRNEALLSLIFREGLYLKEKDEDEEDN